jgi:hypothetical protein
MASAVEGMGLFEALTKLSRERKSGRLHVRQWEDKEGIVGLNDGRIVHCQVGRLRGPEAFKVLRNWMSTELRFFENVENLTVDMEEETEEILASLEAQDREIRAIRDVIPNHHVIFALSQEGPQSRVALDPRIWKVLSAVNGRSSVKDICVGLRASEFSVAKVLTYLHGRKFIRTVAMVRPVAPPLREAFFRELEDALAQYIGPIASVVIEDALAALGRGRDYVSRNDLPLLVERIGESVDDESDRIRLQGRMLAVIQRLFKDTE